jgi:hypothetical protein
LMRIVGDRLPVLRGKSSAPLQGTLRAPSGHQQALEEAWPSAAALRLAAVAAPPSGRHATPTNGRR